MGGIFSKANRPKLPGAYFNFENRAADPIPSSPGTAVAILFRNDWGPTDTPVRCSSFSAWQAIFGDSSDTEGYAAVRQAFQGEGGVNGRYGCGEVVAVRIDGSSADAAAITLAKTGGGAAVTLTAKYNGTAGNDLSVEVTTVGGSVDRLRVLKGAVEVERYDYADTDITALAADITANSDWIVPSAVTTGTDIDQATDGALTGGDDGTTLISADYTDALDLLEVEPFAVFCAANLTDSTIATAVATWVANTNETGKRFFGVFGGADAEALATAQTRSSDNANPNVLNVGAFTLTDSLNGPDGDPIDLSSAQVAPRFAGIVAGRGEYASLVGARLPGTVIKTGLTYAETSDAYDSGVITVARDSNAASPVYVRVGLTTWTQDDADSDPSKPYRTYRQPKYVRTMHGIETDLTADAEARIGLGSVDENARTSAVGAAKAMLAAREAQSVIQPGWTVGIDQNPPPTDEDEFIALSLSASFGRSLDQVFWTATVS